MPIYEYKCEKCENRFEMRRSITDRDEDLECPKCGCKQVNKLYSSFGVSGSSSGSGCAPSAVSGGG